MWFFDAVSERGGVQSQQAYKVSKGFETKMKKTQTIIIVIIVAAIAGAAAWYFYSESQKSGFVKGAEKTEDWAKGVGKDTKKLFN